MPSQIYLVAPADFHAADRQRMLIEAVEAAPVAALLLPRGERDEKAYETAARSLIAKVQDAGTALLLEDTPALAKRLGADGVHVTGDEKELKTAISLLKPDMIVGAGGIGSRHEAMLKGEAGADYVFFGSLAGGLDIGSAENAQWWAETFEVPAVHYDAARENASAVPQCEFIGFGTALWNLRDPVAALSAIAEQLESQ